MTKISIIMPVYNTARFLPNTIQSVLNQTESDFELICVDDGSSDNSLEVLHAFAQEDPRIRVFSQTNQGAATARNAALLQATGEYIAYLDSDDCWHPAFLNVMVSSLVKNNVDVAWCDTCIWGENETIQNIPKEITSMKEAICSDIFAAFVRRSSNLDVNIWNKVYRADVVRPFVFENGIVYGEDVIYTYKVLYNSQKAVHVEAPLIYYRERSGSVTRSSFSQKKVLDIFKTAQILEAYFKDKAMDPTTRNVMAERIAKMYLKTCVNIPVDETGSRKRTWNLLSDQLRALKESGVYQPQYLNLRNRIKSYLFLNKHFTLLHLCHK